jgi:hypothetical protein
MSLWINKQTGQPSHLLPHAPVVCISSKKTLAENTEWNNADATTGTTPDLSPLIPLLMTHQHAQSPEKHTILGFPKKSNSILFFLQPKRS